MRGRSDNVARSLKRSVGTYPDKIKTNTYDCMIDIRTYIDRDIHNN